jgi:demethylmenaquinone methyltransferase/2-methoxy-6-polyprenyl-1,4-benzoquinol methylase
MNENTPPENQPGVLRVLQSKEETRAFYDKIARVYDLLSEHSERKVRETGLEVLAASPGEHLLEIGVGTGHGLADLARAVGPDGRVFGIDLSENMVALAQECLNQEGLAERAEVQTGDAEHLPFESESMDGVFMSFTLELFDTPDIPNVLEECRRVLKPGGRIAVVAISKEGKQGMAVHAFEWTHRHFPNLMDCRPIYVAKAIESAGFRVDDKLIEHMWVPVEIVLGVKA